MSFINFIKDRIESLPQSVGRPLTHVPFGLRLGTHYTRSTREIALAECGDSSHMNSMRLNNLRFLIQAAFEQVDFYRSFYRSKGFTPGDLRSWDDWEHVPVVTKADLQEVPLASRLAEGKNGFKINTGGTSGQPLEFHLDSNAFAREWAHMHYIWKARGYRPQHLKLTLRGKHFNTQQVLRYNAVHNELIVNSNAPMNEVATAIATLPKTTIIRWVHGYPSLVAELSHAFADLPAKYLVAFRSRLFGVLLGSEFPAPVYRTVIEETLSSNIVSWYGHSEMAVLARETARGVYESLPTYGFAEAVRNKQGCDYRLVCTALQNYVHPFIRYDTGDLIEPVSKLGSSLAFRITEGRVGDYVLDRKGNKHSLTAIIFGRHHAAFDLLQHLQVRQDALGCVTLVITPRCKEINELSLRQGLDLQDLDIEWRIEIAKEPVRTNSGKIKLKIL